MSGERRCAATLPIPCPAWTPTEEDAHCSEHRGYETFWKEKAEQLTADWIASPTGQRWAPRSLSFKAAEHVRAYEAFVARWLEDNFVAKRSPQ